MAIYKIFINHIILKDSRTISNNSIQLVFSSSISVTLCESSVELCVNKTYLKTYTERHRGFTERHRGNLFNILQVPLLSSWNKPHQKHPLHSVWKNNRRQSCKPDGVPCRSVSSEQNQDSSILPAFRGSPAS